MDVEILSRLQFALTIMFHYIYPQLSIGLGLILVIMEAIYLKTGNSFYLQMTKFWTTVFALTFAFGVATGIVMEFEFGTNWATYSRYVGDVFGSALAAEGVFAFFLESGFLAILLFGWDRVGRKLHFFATLMVCLGAHFSAIWIIVANSWMQTPAGFHIVGEGLAARAEITDFWVMVFNPSSVVRLLHSVVGAWLSGSFMVISVAAYYILKKKYLDFAKSSMKIALIVAIISCFLQAILGDQSGKIIAKHQPAKLAALEGVFKTEKGAPLILFGLVNTAEEKVEYSVRIPRLLSYLSFGDFSAEFKGLDQVSRSDWPKVAAIFQIYRIMIAMWAAMLILSLMAAYMWYRGTLFSSNLMLKILMVSVMFPQIANQAGWLSAEMGRYPWIVQGLLRISDGLSKAVTANQVLGSLIMFTILYILLFLVFLYLLNEKFKHGPGERAAALPYHQIATFVEELKHESHD